MQIFSSSDARVRSAAPCGKSTTTPGIDHRLCVIPATAGLGHTSGYVYLSAAARSPVATPEHVQWWACLQGGVRVLDGDEEFAMLASGDVLVPPERPLALQAAIDSVLVRAVALPQTDDKAEDHAADTVAAEFIALEPGEPDWAQRFHARGLLWAVCHHGTLCLQWRDKRRSGKPRMLYVRPGMAFAPAPGDDYCIDAMMPGTGLLCCMRNDAMPESEPEPNDADTALPRTEPRVPAPSAAACVPWPTPRPRASRQGARQSR